MYGDGLLASSVSVQVGRPLECGSSVPPPRADPAPAFLRVQHRVRGGRGEELPGRVHVHRDAHPVHCDGLGVQRVPCGLLQMFLDIFITHPEFF